MNDDNPLKSQIESLRNSKNIFDYHVDLDDPRINQYKGYASIEFDLKVVKRYLNALNAINMSVKDDKMDLDELTQTLERSLFTSSIISYARCFTETKGRGIQLDANKFFKGHDRLKDIHQRLMDVRHQHLAHAGISDNEFIYARANFNMDGNSVDWKLTYDIVVKITHSDDEITDFISIVDHLSNLVGEKRDKSAARYKADLSLDEKNELLRKAISEKKAS